MKLGFHSNELLNYLLNIDCFYANFSEDFMLFIEYFINFNNNQIQKLEYKLPIREDRLVRSRLGKNFSIFIQVLYNFIAFLNILYKSIEIHRILIYIHHNYLFISLISFRLC